MSIISTVCPHCERENVAFTSIAEKQHNRFEGLYIVFYFCNNCEFGISAAIKVNHDYIKHTPHNYPHGIDNHKDYSIVEIFPRAKQPDMLEYLPDTIRRLFKQAITKAKDEEYKESTAIMCRKTLEESIKILDKDCPSAYKLSGRIERCATLNIIAPPLKEWAHIIRLDGNEAVHEEITHKEALDLVNFTHMFLMYAFTMPKMIELRKEGNIKPE